jgi:nucleotide-binding universal stress UspA family protein
MTDERHLEPQPGPILLCAGTDPTAARALAQAAGTLLADRPAIVLATWASPPVTGGFDAVLDALYDTHAGLRGLAHDAATDAARAARDVLRTHVLDVSARVCPDDGILWQVILDVADEIDAGVIVAGITEQSSPHPGSLGRQARALAHRSHRPLLLLPTGVAPAAPETPALFAYDGSGHAGHAVGAGVALLRPRRAIVATAWHVTSYAVGLALLAIPDAIAHDDADGLDDVARRKAESVANAGAALLTDAGWPCESATPESRHGVVSALVAAADEHDAAIVVTGTRGRSLVAATLLGSTAEGILRHAGRPVLLVPPPAEQ